jgi:peroxiredoxin
LPRLNALYRRYRAEGLVVLGLNADPRPDAARRVAAREIEYPCLFEAGSICADYGVVAFPATVLIDREGRVREQSSLWLRSSGDTEDEAGLEERLLVLINSSG